MDVPQQYVDPQVSEAKFEREIGEYRALQNEYRRRGWLLLEARFPRAVFTLCAPQLKPPAVITGVAFEFSNYDVEPPSVTFVDPFSGEPYAAKDLPTTLQRRVPTQGFPPPGVAFPPGLQPMMIGHQPLLQAHDPEDIPFLCIAGVREYHAHPAHSGDAWELQREAGAGRLVRLLEVIHKYGIEPISDYQIQLSMSVTGLIQNVVPE